MHPNLQTIKRHDCDALVVGAGPAGATAACILAARGLQVVLLDKCRFPRRKLCAGLITWKTVQLLKETFGVDPAELARKGIIHNRSRRYAIHNRLGELFQGRLDYPFHYVDRTLYDALWVDMARKAGAEVCLQEAVTGVDVDETRVTTSRRRTLRAGVILAADGATSRVRRQLEKRGYLRANWRNGLAMGVEAVFERGPQSGFQNWPVIYLDFVPWGYGWSFPGGEHQSIGLCRLIRRGGPSVRNSYRQLLQALAVGSTPREAAAVRPLPYGNYIARGGHRSILLLGDACGLTDPLLGEGIYYAHRSGQLAADAVTAVQPRWKDAQSDYAHRLKPAVIDELKRIRLWRWLVFTLLCRGHYRGLAFLMGRFQKKVEAMVQGQRRFGLRPSIDRHGGSVLRQRVGFK